MAVSKFVGKGKYYVVTKVSNTKFFYLSNASYDALPLSAPLRGCYGRTVKITQFLFKMSALSPGRSAEGEGIKVYGSLVT